MATESGKDDEWEWENSDDEAVENPPKIQIEDNLIKIDRKKIDWSDDEFDETNDNFTQNIIPPPPPPPPKIPLPPPLPQNDIKKKVRNERVEQLKRRPTKRPDWNDLMKVKFY